MAGGEASQNVPSLKKFDVEVTRKEVLNIMSLATLYLVFKVALTAHSVHSIVKLIFTKKITALDITLVLFDLALWTWWLRH